MTAQACIAAPPIEELKRRVAQKANDLIEQHQSLNTDLTLNARVQQLMIESRLRELQDTLAGRICPLTDDNVRRLLSWLTALN